MNTIIAGTRTITDPALLQQAIDRCGWTITGVVCGGARGVDTMGIAWAKEHDIPVLFVFPDWAAYGGAAGPLRNTEMAKQADALILVWDGVSRGSARMLRIARQRRLQVYEFIVVDAE